MSNKYVEMSLIKYCFILFSVFVYSQNKGHLEYYYEAELKLLPKGDTSNAIVKLKESIKYKPTYKSYSLLGKIYTRMDSLDMAFKTYEEGFLVLDSSSQMAYTIAELSFDKLNNFEQAEKYYDLFLKKSPKNSVLYKTALKRHKNSVFAKEAVKHPVEFNPKNVGKNVNTANMEYSPTISSNQKMLIYTKREFKNNWVENLYYSPLIDGEWGEGKLLPGKINSRYNEGAGFLSANGKFMFFTGCNRHDGIGSCDIYLSILREDGWGLPLNIGLPVNTKHWESNPSLSPDGRVLYFSSNRPGGKGGKDIWYSEFKRGKWSEPKNLEIINTEYNEETPFIHIDNNTLYFSSDGFDGMGDLDFFMSKRDSTGNWQYPENLGFPINNKDEQYSLAVARDGKTAFFATISAHKETNKDLDIYYFILPEDKMAMPTAHIQGYITDNSGKVLENAKMSIYDVYSGERVKNFDLEKGKYFGTLQKDKTYALQVIDKDFMIYSENFKVQNNLDLEYDIVLDSVKENEISELNNILFEYNKSDLKKESIQELERVVEFLNLNPNISVEIGGHTDNMGSKAYNDKLSVERSKSVYDFLIKKGIMKNRLTSKGYGFSKPLNDNETEEDKKLNRRTELKVIKVDF